jgi:hypothetical protein
MLKKEPLAEHVADADVHLEDRVLRDHHVEIQTAAVAAQCEGHRAAIAAGPDGGSNGWGGQDAVQAVPHPGTGLGGRSGQIHQRLAAVAAPLQENEPLRVAVLERVRHVVVAL